MSYAPEPSPAPTLAGVPGFFPPTPDLASSSSAQPEPFSTPTASDPAADGTANSDDYAHRANNTTGVLIGAAAGFVVGGPVGAAIAGGLVGLGELENDTIKAQQSSQHADRKDLEATPTTKPADLPFDAQHDKSQAALEESPAQTLLASHDTPAHQDQDDDGAKLTGAGAMGGALLAGAAGAKVMNNEVEDPATTTSTDEDALTPTASHANLAPEPEPSAPDFGTPAVEKEQAALADSPAQRLLGTRTDSTVGDETALLAGGAGAVAPEREVEEPELEAPKDQMVASAGVPAEESHSEPLERQVSSVPNPAPMTPRPEMQPHESTTSFAAAVLAASQGIDTPTREEVPLSMSGSTGKHPLVRASDESINDGDSIKTTQAPTEPSLSETRKSYPNVLPSFTPAAVAAGTAAPTLADKGKGVDRGSENLAGDDEVVHNPPPQVLAAAVPANDLVEGGAPRPADFEPYTPPAVPEQQEAEMTESKGKGKEPEILAATVAGGAGAAVLAHELKRGDHAAVGDEDRPSSQPGSLFQENFTPHPQAIERDPLVDLDDQRAIPPQQAQGDPVLVMPMSSLDKGKGRAIDPEDLHNVPSTSPEQAGFAPGAKDTVAAREFAHLSEPAPQAELAAQQGLGERERAGPAAVVVPGESNVGHRNVAIPATAGLAAGAAAPLVVGRLDDPTAHPAMEQAVAPTSVAPVNPTSPIAAEAAPIQPAKAVPPAPAPAPARATGVQPTPSPARQQVPVQQQVPIQPQRASSPHGLAEGVERSPHMHIQTHQDESGHKKLHRKSLAADRKPLTFGIGATKSSKPDKTLANEGRRDRLMDGWSGVPDPTVQRQPAVQQAPAMYHPSQAINHPQQPQPVAQQPQSVPIHQQPRMVPQPQQQVQPAHPQALQPGVRPAQAPAAPTGALIPGTAAHEYALSSPNPAPAAGGPPRQQVAYPAQASNPSSPSSPVGPAGTNAPGETHHRKLSKSRPRSKSNASGSDREKGGFLSKVFGRHSRSGSGSVDGSSPRASSEMQRPAQV
ncbi:hypothetical protein JCM10212_004064 [Sporobolomyces blumeae]